MKKFLMVFVIGLVFTSVAYADSKVDRYILFGESKWGVDYFDRQTIKATTDAQNGLIVDVWVKEIYSDFGRKEIMKDYIQRHSSVDRIDEVSYCLMHFLIAKGKNRLIYNVEYSKDGEVLENIDYSNVPWEDTVPKSLVEAIQETTFEYVKKKNLIQIDNNLESNMIFNR